MESFSWGKIYGTLLLAAAAASTYFTGGEEFFIRKHIVSWYDPETCSKVTEDAAVGQKTYNLLLVSHSNYGSISYRFCAAMSKWHCWATVTSKLQWNSIQITSQNEIALKLSQDFRVNPCTDFCRQTNFADKQREWEINRPDHITSRLAELTNDKHEVYNKPGTH